MAIFEGSAVVEFQSRKVNPKDAAAKKQKEVDELQKVVGEQTLIIRVLKKSIEMAERDENE